jgi:hypothetical protein
MLWMRWLWALPVSLPGLLLWCWVRGQHGSRDAQMGVYPHGRARLLVWHAHGASVAWWLKRYPFIQVEALCIGCVVLAIDEVALQRCWVHEMVHVKQAMRWGLLFPLLYFASSAWARLRGRDAYRDNVFEQQAFAAEQGAHTGTNTPK